MKTAFLVSQLCLLILSDATAAPPLIFQKQAEPSDFTDTPHLIFTNVSGADAPVWITHAGDGSSRVFFVEQGGTVRIIGKDAPFLDLSSTNAAIITINGSPAPGPVLVSAAFPPGYTNKGYFYVSYYDPAPGQTGLKISRFYVTDAPDLADRNTEQVVGRYSGIGCGGGQIVFGDDGTLYLNYGGPVANATLSGFSQDLNSLSGKMRPILNENSQPFPPTPSEPFWPFEQYFAATNCSIIGGAFDASTSARMNGIYFYGDASGTFWGLKPEGTNWVQLNFGAPTFQYVFGWDTTGLSGGSIPTNPLTNIITINTNPGSIIPPITILPPANGSNFWPTASSMKKKVSSRAARTSLTTNEDGVIVLQPATNTAPFTITAFGTDEDGRVYVANFGAPYYVEAPPTFQAVQKFVGGGIYRLDDDQVQINLTTVTNSQRVTLEWQSVRGVKYRVQVSVDGVRWNTFRSVTGTGRRIVIANVPKNRRFHFKVVALPSKKSR